MTQRRRRAVFEADLVIIDEPQLFVLTAGKSKVIALAVPEVYIEGEDFDHIAASVTAKNWDRYISGYVDLRYLFTYPFQRTLYVFHSRAMHEGTVMLRPVEAEFSESLLPSHGFFSSSHTEDYGSVEQASDEEQLFIDGEWQLNEFGAFYQKYSDIYFFSAAIKNSERGDFPQVFKGKIQNAFSRKPFKGGSSYMHMFDELQDCLPRGEKLSLEGIEYNSPGDVRMNGVSEHFASIEKLISNFTIHRNKIREAHRALREYMTKHQLLAMSATRYQALQDHDDDLLKGAKNLSAALNIDAFSTISNLCNDNALVIAKVMLAIFRRVEAASRFFAEGRMSFEKDD